MVTRAIPEQTFAFGNHIKEKHCYDQVHLVLPGKAVLFVEHSSVEKQFKVLYINSTILKKENQSRIKAT